MRPGEPSDMTYMDKINRHLSSHAHFESNATKRNQDKSMLSNEFVIRHYAGSVKYSVLGFMDRNNNFLFRNLKEVFLKDNKSL